ncbi:MAG: hypothetical protein ABI081_04470 [Burkholderiaceae bacterium]
MSVSVDSRYTFDNFALAHAALEERRQIGKSVLDVRATCV